MSHIKRFWDAHFLGFELVLSLLGGILFTIWVIWLGGSGVVDSILHDNRSAVYGALAQIFGSLLGFVIAALSIIIGYSTNEKFEFLRKSKHYPTLWKVLIRTIRALSLATLMMVAGLILDRDSAPQHLILCACVFATLLSLFRLRSCLWVLENVILIMITV
jgi:hypothetical protein